MCESCKKPFYITTPIYYPSSNLHIGHAYCSTAADSMARFKKLTGYDVYFLTGTDEHGQKIERKAKEQGVTPKEYVDKIVAGIKDLWKLMDIDYSDFIRTTDDRHVKCVQKIFKQLYDQGDIYKSEYEGWYCTPCESFWTELQLKDGCCPDCGRPVEKTREESYFFRLQKYAEWLIQYIEEHPDFIQPASRANEMLNNFLRPGLEDLCVSRTSIKWGIPVTFDEKHTVYVWIDALSNYISALGYGTDNDALFQKYWPADVHLVGKDGERTILSGIAKYYKPEDLVGKQVVAVVNLAPRKIAGIESQGMILSAVDDEDNLRLMSVGEGVEDGAIIG